MLAGHEMSVSSYWHRLLQIPTMESDWPIRPSDSFYLICHQMAGKNPPVKQADFRSFYTCLTASRCKGFERILIKGLAPIFDIIRSNSLYVLDFLFVQQSLFNCFLSSSVNTRERVKNRFPSGPSNENIPQQPSTTSMISCVCFQYSYWSLAI